MSSASWPISSLLRTRKTLALAYANDSSTAVKNADLVIESIVENLELKQNLFAALDKVAR